MNARAFAAQGINRAMFERQSIPTIIENPPTTRDIAAECIAAAQADADEDVGAPLGVIGKTLALLDAIGEGDYVSVGMFSEHHSEFAFRTWASVRGFDLVEAKTVNGAVSMLRLDTGRWSVTMYMNAIGSSK